MTSPNAELLSALADLSVSGEYSDLTLRSGSDVHKLHRAIVCPRSEFFAHAIRSGLMESQTGEIVLSDDDPEIVKHMINYFYHLDYLTKSPARRSSLSSQRSTSPATRRQIRVPQKSRKPNPALDPLAAVAAAYATDSLTDDTTDSHTDYETATKSPYVLVEDEVEDDYFVAVQKDETCEPDTSRLLTHAQVYAIAEKYVIPGLKVLARQKFMDQLEIDIRNSNPIIPEAFAQVYESTVETDRGLRDVVIQAFRTHRDLDTRKDIREMLRNLTGLPYDLYLMGRGLPLTL